MKKIIVVLSIVVAFFVQIASSSSCNKGCPDRLFYRIPYTLFPMQDTFKIGDTLLADLSFDKDLTDEIGGIKNSFPDFNFRIHVSCDRMDIDPPLAHTLDYLGIHTFIGSDSSTNLPISGVSYYSLTPVYSSGKYVYKCAFILKEKGLFYFGLGPTSSRENPFEINGECDQVTVHIGSKLAHAAENNFHMLQWAANPVYHKIDEKQFNDYGGFCFVVE